MKKLTWISLGGSALTLIIGLFSVSPKTLSDNAQAYFDIASGTATAALTSNFAFIAYRFIAWAVLGALVSISGYKAGFHAARLKTWLLGTMRERIREVVADEFENRIAPEREKILRAADFTNAVDTQLRAQGYYHLGREAFEAVRNLNWQMMPGNWHEDFESWLEASDRSERLTIEFAQCVGLGLGWHDDVRSDFAKELLDAIDIDRRLAAERFETESFPSPEMKSRFVHHAARSATLINYGKPALNSLGEKVFPELPKAGVFLS